MFQYIPPTPRPSGTPGNRGTRGSGPFRVPSRILGKNAWPGQEPSSKRTLGPIGETLDIVDVAPGENGRQFYVRHSYQSDELCREWIAEESLDSAMRAQAQKWCDELDSADQYRAYDTLSPTAWQAAMVFKERSNRLHAELVAIVERFQLARYPKAVHITLLHPSEKCRSAKALEAVGIDKSRIHCPSPHAYAKLCAAGYPNIHHCWLSELPPRLQELCASVFADFTGSWSDQTLRELYLLFKRLRMTPFVVFSITLSSDRRSTRDEWLNAIKPVLAELFHQCGYEFYDLVNGQREHSYQSPNHTTMFYFSWILASESAKPYGPVLPQPLEQLARIDTLRAEMEDSAGHESSRGESSERSPKRSAEPRTLPRGWVDPRDGMGNKEQLAAKLRELDICFGKRCTRADLLFIYENAYSAKEHGD